MRYYPAMLHIEGRLAVVAGGGKVALRKAMGLLEAGALVLAVSPEPDERLVELEQQGKLRLAKREYEEQDLVGAVIAIAATDRPAVNARIAADARSRSIPCNVADDAALGTFATPATVRRGKLVLAVTASGASPALAMRIRDDLAAAYGAEYEPYLDWLQDVRTYVLASDCSEEERRLLLQAALDAPPEWRQQGGSPADIAQMLRKLRSRVAAGEHGDGRENNGE